MPQTVVSRQETERLTTVSGKFYVGMKADEAKEKNIFTSCISQNFKDIDKNHNNILEDWEICDERDKECTENESASAFCMGAGAGVAVLAGILAPFTGGITALVGGALGLAGAAGGGYTYKTTSEEQKITDQYRKKHQLNTEG